eukprot:scaffold28348_cov21-Cyclotella_meneghiniana.AAC.2
MPLHISLITDHGNRKGVDHLVKVIMWSSVDAKGKRLIRRFNLDIDAGEHTATGAAEAIKKSLSVLGLEEERDNLRFSHLHGDRGGGGAVWKIFPELQSLEVLHVLATWTNCMLHALQKALETASIRTFGKQGMGHKNCFQLCYLAIMLMVTVKKKGGRDLLNHYYSRTIARLMQSDEWQRVGDSNFALALQSFMDEIEELEDLSDESIDELIESLKCPANLMQPNFGRWGTVSSAAKVVLDNWTQIYFMAETIKKAEKSESYLYKIANSLLDLMTAKAYPEQENPTHYVSLLFFRAFCKTFFDPHMEWFKRNDPVFGEGSYGQVSRLVPEHMHIMLERFRVLTTNDAWTLHPSFKPFVIAVNGLRELGKDTKGGKEFYETTTATFFKQFERSLATQIKHWQDPDVTWMAVAGHPMIAKWLMRKIANNESAPSDLELDMHLHHMGGTNPPVVNVNECIDFITAENKNSTDIFNQPFIQEFLNELAIIADGDGTIDALDPSTWQGNDLKRIHEGIWNYIAPNSTHQQAAENLVQTANHLAKTNHGEARRTASAMNHCLFARDFNRWAVGKLRRKQKRQEQRRKEANNDAGILDADDKRVSKVRRPEGKQKLKMFIQYSDGILKSIATAKKALTASRVREIHNNLRTSKNKSSTVVAEEKKKVYDAALQKKLNPKEGKLLMDFTPFINGTVVLSYLNGVNGGRPYLLAELDFRDEKKWRDLTDAQKSSMSDKELRYFLRGLERTRLDYEEGIQYEKDEDVSEIKPLSPEMQEWLEEHQERIMNEKNRK